MAVISSSTEWMGGILPPTGLLMLTAWFDVRIAYTRHRNPIKRLEYVHSLSKRHFGYIDHVNNDGTSAMSSHFSEGLDTLWRVPYHILNFERWHARAKPWRGRCQSCAGQVFEIDCLVHRGKEDFRSRDFGRVGVDTFFSPIQTVWKVCRYSTIWLAQALPEEGKTHHVWVG